MEYKDTEVEAFLKHYGVRGMHWGVTKNPSRAFGKSANKLIKLERKSAQRIKRGAQLDRKGLRIQISGVKRGNADRHFKGLKISAKGARVSHRGAKYAEKGRKWKLEMAKTFAKVKASDITEKDMAKGEAYAHLLLGKPTPKKVETNG